MFSLNQLIGRAAVIEVLDIGAMPEGTPRHQPLLDNFAAHVVGFEPNPQHHAALTDTAQHTFLPHFLGDGERATFHITRYPGCCSLYPPNAAVIDLFETIGCAGEDGNFHVIATEAVDTVRLDEVYPRARCDYVKADVQGAELDILTHGTRTLADVLVVETEAAFVELYTGQPLFGDLQVFMREHGFVLHKLIEVAGRPFRPLRRNDNPFAPVSQMLWADAVFVRDFTRLDRLDERALLHGAAILHDVYCSYDLVHLLLAEHDARHRGDLAARYRELLESSGGLPDLYLTQRLQP